VINLKKWLGSGLAAVFAVVLGLALLGPAAEVEAQSPPTPPARFAGTVVVDGAPAVAGTTIEARVGAVVCKAVTVTTAGNYVIDVPADGPASTGCGADGVTVTFYVAGKVAQQTGTWKNYDINVLNLTVVTPTPTPSPSATPKAPATGSGFMTGTAGASWLYVVLGISVLAFGAGTVAATRRS